MFLKLSQDKKKILPNLAVEVGRAAFIKDFATCDAMIPLKVLTATLSYTAVNFITYYNS